ncbi:hypothetical protein TNCV_2781941 [Trichonephila clavipes]|nr:hypothetical protein TNCV_2781941 [Trichonephila clavipes]
MLIPNVVYSGVTLIKPGRLIYRRKLGPRLMDTSQVCDRDYLLPTVKHIDGSVMIWAACRGFMLDQT